MTRPERPVANRIAPRTTTKAATRSGRESRRQNSLSWTRSGVMNERERILYPKSGVVTSGPRACKRKASLISRLSRHPCRTNGSDRTALFGLSASHLAVLHAVCEIDDHANRQPHNQTHPGDAIQAGHQS